MFNKKRYLPIMDAINSGAVSKEDCFLFGQFVIKPRIIKGVFLGLIGQAEEGQNVIVAVCDNKLVLFINNGKMFGESYNIIYTIEKENLEFFDVKELGKKIDISLQAFEMDQSFRIIASPFDKSQNREKALQRLIQLVP